MNLFRRALVMVFAVAAIALGVVAVPASAAQPSSSCPITVGIYPGLRQCDMKYVDIHWSTGIEEVVVVGSDYLIYHIFQLYPTDYDFSSGWSHLGNGEAGTTASGLYLNGRSGTVNASPGGQLAVSGTDGKRYCAEGDGYGDWTAWHHC